MGGTYETRWWAKFGPMAIVCLIPAPAQCFLCIFNSHYKYTHIHIQKILKLVLITVNLKRELKQIITVLRVGKC